MTTLPKPTIVKRSKSALIISLFSALLLTSITVLQLYAFEDMPEIMSHLLPESVAAYGMLVAALLVVLQVTGIPYFLPLALSPLARALSLVTGIGALLVWLGLNIYALFSELGVNTGIFGAKVDFPVGAASIAVIFIILMNLVMAAIYTQYKR